MRGSLPPRRRHLIVTVEWLGVSHRHPGEDGSPWGQRGFGQRYLGL